MNTKVYKQVCQILRVTEVKDSDGYIEKYIIEIRDNKKGPWRNVFESPVLRKVIFKKHYFVHFAMRHLGYGARFLDRRKKKVVHV